LQEEYKDKAEYIAALSSHEQSCCHDDAINLLYNQPN
jgi:hypothetical protein